MKKTICLNMIVKGESAVIRRCLESVKHLIDYWVIVDTGSKDGTQRIIQDFMKDIPGELHERPWVNFGHNRNEALELARGKGNYFLFIDADDRLVFEEGFVMPELDRDYYLVIQQNKNEYGVVKQPIILMIRDLPDLLWEGTIHESIPLDISRSHGLLADVIYEYLHDGARACDPDKYKKDISLLKKAIEDDPLDARSVFYLAQTYLGAQEYELALRACEKRALMGGLADELYHCHFCIGVLKKALNRPFIKTLCDTYLFRPSRSDSLFELSRHYLEIENYFLGYLVTEFALSIPMNKDRFIQTWIYEWGILLNYFFCASGIGEEAKAAAALKKLLEIPNLPKKQKDYLKECQ